MPMPCPHLSIQRTIARLGRVFSRPKREPCAAPPPHQPNDRTPRKELSSEESYVIIGTNLWATTSTSPMTQTHRLPRAQHSSQPVKAQVSSQAVKAQVSSQAVKAQVWRLCGRRLLHAGLLRSFDASHAALSNFHPDSSFSSIFLRVFGWICDWNSTREM